MTKADLIWLAGFIDGEGYISFYPRNRSRAGNRRAITFTKIITISQVDRKIIDTICSWFDTEAQERKPRTGQARKAYTFRLYGLRAVKLLKAVLPYLKLKKEQAKIVLAAPMKYKTKDLKQQWLIDKRLKEIKHRRS